MAGIPDYYELLGIAPDAGDEEIRAAHRRAAGYWHPDRNRSPNAAEMMRHVNAARDTLLSPSKRQEYNQRRRAGRRPPEARPTEARSSGRAESPPPNQGRDSGKTHERRGKGTNRLRKYAIGIAIVAAVVFFINRNTIEPGSLPFSGATPAPMATRTTLSALSLTPGAPTLLAPTPTPRATSIPDAPTTQPDIPTAIVPLPTPTAVVAPLPTCESAPGELIHAASSGSIVSDGAGGVGSAFPWDSFRAANFDVTISFQNPSETSWSYGIAFRRASPEAMDLVVIASNEFGELHWGHYRIEPSSTGWSQIRRERLNSSEIVVGAGETNTLRLLATGQQGEIFVNGASLGSIALETPDGLRNLVTPTLGFYSQPVSSEVAYEGFEARCPS